MLIHVNSAKCIGIDAVKVTVETDIDRGIGIHLVGLADIAVKESLLRTTTALASLGYQIPGKKIVINLAPADLHKSGSGYDLPIALGIVAASGRRELPLLEKYLVLGELGLDGSVRDIPGGLPCAELAAKEGFAGCILPLRSALEAVEYPGIEVYGVGNFEEVVRILSGEEDCSDLLIRHSAAFRELCSRRRPAGGSSGPELDFADIIGQEGAKRGVEIAAAGGHNLVMVGPPGAGKSSLARAMAGILPEMTLEESLITSKIYSVSGHGREQYSLMRRRPFRAPHYSASLPAIIGGGADRLIPGEVSLAHNGVLFLDELGQMPKSVIEALRAPIEDRKVVISRLRSKIEFPCSFMLAAASNPCPCGYWGEGDRCTCTPAQRAAYLSKLSGPILDRIDLHLWVRPVPASSIAAAKGAPGSGDASGGAGAAPGRSSASGGAGAFSGSGTAPGRASASGGGAFGGSGAGRESSAMVAAREPSSAVAARVAAARKIQQRRFRDEDIATNAEMNNKQVEHYCPLDETCTATMATLMEKMGLSMRAYYRIIKVARTIADIEGAPQIRREHLIEAASFRFLDRRNILE
ncbi:MAG: YifB family Mg chelatase-like AAA ATPase [Bacteroidales bacterium]|nr:YifB family Mg chelatase-like AAA ATPase [Bacteroidales bacterium]